MYYKLKLWFTVISFASMNLANIICTVEILLLDLFT